MPVHEPAALPCREYTGSASFEAIEGEMYVTPAPKTSHQAVSMNLTAALLRLLVDPGHGRLFCAPVGVEFVETEEGVQPDLVFVSTARLKIVREDAVQGAPDLVVERRRPEVQRRAARMQSTRRRLPAWPPESGEEASNGTTLSWRNSIGVPRRIHYQITTSWYRRTRSSARQGIQVGTVDALLAALCLKHDLTMLSTDTDFRNLRKVAPLRIWEEK